MEWRLRSPAKAALRIQTASAQEILRTHQDSNYQRHENGKHSFIPQTNIHNGVHARPTQLLVIEKDAVPSEWTFKARDA